MEKLDTRLDCYLNTNVSEYLASGMRNNGVWATEIEILATASLLNTDIVVFARCGEKMDWLRYPSSLSLDVLTEEVIFLSNETKNHFNVVLSA